MKPVILLVDDEEDLVTVLREAIDLSLPGYRAVGSTSADDAERLLDTLGRGELCLVCVDHRLGGRTGLELLERIRRRYPHMPAMLFTGQAPPAVEIRAKELGARVVWKPLRLSQWLGEVHALLGSAPTVAEAAAY